MWNCIRNIWIPSQENLLKTKGIFAILKSVVLRLYQSNNNNKKSHLKFKNYNMFHAVIIKDHSEYYAIYYRQAET